MRSLGSRAFHRPRAAQSREIHYGYLKKASAGDAAWWLSDRHSSKNIERLPVEALQEGSTRSHSKIFETPSKIIERQGVKA